MVTVVVRDRTRRYRWATLPARFLARLRCFYGLVYYGNRTRDRNGLQRRPWAIVRHPYMAEEDRADSQTVYRFIAGRGYRAKGRNNGPRIRYRFPADRDQLV